MLVFIFLLAVLADLRFADTLFAKYHPVIGIGNLIKRMEAFLYPVKKCKILEFIAGLGLTVCVVLSTYFVVKFVIFISSMAGIYLFYLIYFYLIYALIACGGLAREAKNVLITLQMKGLSEARIALARIVGRETEQLDEEEICRAVIETVAENFSDGVVAPLFYFYFGGLPLAWAYKAVNTLDSMLGYKDSHYIYFGRAAAYLDDLANFIPARLSALLIITAGFFQGLDWRSGWIILKRDRLSHSSPNSGHPEAAMAGILGLRLGGDNNYHGLYVKKPFIGDDLNKVTREHILKTVNNLYLSSVIYVILLVSINYL